MAQAREYYELYRRSSVGAALVETLDEMVNGGVIEPQLAMKALSSFDKAATDVLSEKVKAKMNFKGHLDTYRFCDEVWTFVIRDLNIKLDQPNHNITADRIKVVSCNAKKPGET